MRCYDVLTLVKKLSVLDADGEKIGAELENQPEKDLEAEYNFQMRDTVEGRRNYDGEINPRRDDYESI